MAFTRSESLCPMGSGRRIWGLGFGQLPYSHKFRCGSCRDKVEPVQFLTLTCSFVGTFEAPRNAQFCKLYIGSATLDMLNRAEHSRQLIFLHQAQRPPLWMSLLPDMRGVGASQGLHTTIILLIVATIMCLACSSY